MDDEQDDPGQPSPTRGTQSQDTSFDDGDSTGALVQSKTIDRVKPLDPGSVPGILQPVEATAIDAIARKTTTMRESASGYAATIAAISRLPEATQLRQLELDNELSSRELDLEKHRLDLMARDRSEKRAEKTQRILAATAEETKRIQGHRLETQRTELLNYIFASIGTLILLVLVFYLYVTGQSQVATPILSAAVAFGAGFAGGNGYAKRHYREPGRKGKESD